MKRLLSTFGLLALLLVVTSFTTPLEPGGGKKPVIFELQNEPGGGKKPVIFELQNEPGGGKKPVIFE
jgi:hypothetical protein